jgi:UDP-N-acetyl-D-glucosamine/UDP-N-acetyl-D-galactosamine dehydrogenase
MKNKTIGIIGLGYVGLPLAIEFSKFFKTIGFDLNSKRVKDLNDGIDSTNEANLGDLKAQLSNNLVIVDNLEKIRNCNIFIITVPTPITKFKTPDLSYLISASKSIGSILKKGDIVIYESTVYPGCTEEECVPVLETSSGLIYNKDFFCGYSPERINPGDKLNTLTKIKKVTSGSTPEIAKVIDDIYGSIITAGTHLASSIKVAEASKAIENAQRDLNISFVNELALIFDKIGIDTEEVIDAAATKWNFLKFKPGLVGGHCISVDPYYLAYKAESMGYYPEVILSGRRVNDQMGKFVAEKVVKLMNQKGIPVRNSRALILGITFKEDCPDIRNSKVPDIYNELKNYGLLVDIYDPKAIKQEVKHEFKIDLIDQPNSYNAIILAVSHNEFKSLDLGNLKSKQGAVVYDIKSFLDKKSVDGRL